MQSRKWFSIKSCAYAIVSLCNNLSPEYEIKSVDYALPASLESKN